MHSNNGRPSLHGRAVVRDLFDLCDMCSSRITRSRTSRAHARNKLSLRADRLVGLSIGNNATMAVHRDRVSHRCCRRQGSPVAFKAAQNCPRFSARFPGAVDLVDELASVQQTAMLHQRKTISFSAIPFMFALAMGATACGDDDGADGGADGGTGTPDPDPDPEGEQCDIPGANGWDFECHLGSAHAWYETTQFLSNTDPFVLSDVYPGTEACCEGCAPAEVADEACETKCYEALCGQVRDMHNQNKGLSCELPWVDCGFQWQACVDGEHRGVEIISTGLWSIAEYHVSCNDADSQPDPGPNGCSDPGELSGTCQVPAGLVPTPATDYVAQSGAGTTATVQWQFGGTEETARTSDLAAEIAYSVRPCADGMGECLHLTSLSVDLPETTVGGLVVERAHAKLSAAHSAPHLDARGGFTFDPGALDVALSANDGLAWHRLASNTEPVTGRVSPAANTLSLSGLTLAHQDSMFAADLRIDIQGTYTRRAPDAVVALVDAPLDCAEPVAFRAASVSHDGNPLTHQWVALEAHGSGALFEVVLPSGSHAIQLTSVTADGLMNTTTHTYDRQCQ